MKAEELRALSLPDLKAKARERGLTGVSALRKDALVAALLAAPDGAAPPSTSRPRRARAADGAPTDAPAASLFDTAPASAERSGVASDEAPRPRRRRVASAEPVAFTVEPMPEMPAGDGGCLLYTSDAADE